MYCINVKFENKNIQKKLKKQITIACMCIIYTYIYIPIFIRTIYITKYIKNLLTYFYNHTIFTMFTANHYMLLF